MTLLHTAHRVRSYKGSTDKFSRAILTHLFCPHFALDPPHSFGYASGLPPCSDEKIYANLTDFILSAIPKDFVKATRNYLFWSMSA